MAKIKRVDLSKLNPQQRAAFVTFAKDCKHFAPQMRQFEATAKTLFTQLLKSPEWGVVQAEQPDAAQALQEFWHVGAPQVNYVENIERPS